MSAKRKVPPVPLFDSVVFAPDRDRIPGTRPVISWDEDDEEAYLKSIEEVATRKAKLQRRGHHHGAWAELDLSSSGVDPMRHPVSTAEAKERWDAARPWVLPKVLQEFCAEQPAAEVAEGLELGARLSEPQAFDEYLKARSHKLPDSLTRVPETDTTGADDPLTLEKVYFSQEQGPNLWVKSSRLSTFEADTSLRFRVSFGAEVDDDASSNEDSHRAVTNVAEALMPGAARIDLHPGIQQMFKDVVGEELNLTQHIAYWNAPQGGALMHHDAFGEANCGGQRGVLYTQVAGHTAWLALSLRDLADRVEDYCEFLESGGADWVRKALWPDRRDFDRVQARVRNRKVFEEELSEPGCGRFSGLVNLGPEFTSFLADAGHGFILGPGDALVMPSHGLTETTMHSVFCASDEMTYGISAALRGSGARSEPSAG